MITGGPGGSGGVATAWDSLGYHGCWVIAVGTNDTANVSAGSSAGLMSRIQEMVSAAHGQPVMWITHSRRLLRRLMARYGR